jgi:5-formyltetrahydrofolate cyclo-ligase
VDDKQAVRECVWSRMQASRVARFPGARGRIPNFVGAEAAARMLAATPEWRIAETLKANPDAPQLPVRAAALAEGKVVFMAVPRLRTAEPFLALDPAALTVAPRAAASISGSSEHGRPTAIGDLPRIDLIVCGSVAVDPKGKRIGKGGGYSDLEFALLRETALIDDSTVVATTVHPLQVLDGDLPETEHDFRVDLIVTPDGVIRTPSAGALRHRPRGILWDQLDRERIDAIPVLRALAPQRAGTRAERSGRSGSW